MKEWLLLLAVSSLCSQIQGCDDPTSKWKKAEKNLEFRNLEKEFAPFAPFAGFEQEVENIKRVRTKLGEMEKMIAEFHTPLDARLDVLRYVEDRGLVLMLYLTDAYEATDSSSFSRKIRTFLERCNSERGPLEFIQMIREKTDDALRSYPNESRNQAMRSIFGNLHRLTIVYLFQQKMQVALSGGNQKEAESNLRKLDSRVQLIRKHTVIFLQEISEKPLCIPATLQPGAFEIDEDCENDGTRNLTKTTGNQEISNDKNDGREYVEVAMKTVLAIMGAIPDFGFMSGIVSPLIEFALKGEDKTIEIIQKGFQKINYRLDEIEGRILTELQLQTVKSVENTAWTLTNFLQEIYKENDAVHRNRTITDFLGQCENNKPFQTIVELHGQIGDVLSTQWNNDPHHRKSEINKLKERIFNSINKLTLVYLSQQHFGVDFIKNFTIDERDKRIVQLERRLQVMYNEISGVLKELSQRNYWDGLKKGIDILMERPASNLSVTSNIVEEYLRDIYTSDKFCVATYLKDQTHPLKIALTLKYFDENGPMIPQTYGNGENILTFENKEYLIKIIRSKSAHETCADSFRKKVDTEQQYCRMHSCTQYPFTVILRQALKLDGSPDEASIVRCKLEPEWLMLDTDCAPWQGVSDSLPAKCHVLAIPT